MVRMVLVDTDDLLFKLKTSLFSREGVLLLTAKSGQDVLRMAATNAPDLVFMNIDLPDMSGAECCGLLKRQELTRHIPVVMSAPADRTDDIEDLVEAGCDAVIPKPLVCKEFVAAVGNFIKLEERALYRMPTRFPVLHWTDSERVVVGYSVNLSTNGMFIETDETVAAGSAIEVKFLLPGGERKICCTARVAWVNSGKHSRSNLPSGMGVQFEGTSCEDKILIAEFISESLKQSRLKMGSFSAVEWVA
jgi:uncharacterized protein (TIGR02266 family)